MMVTVMSVFSLRDFGGRVALDGFSGADIANARMRYAIGKMGAPAKVIREPTTKATRTMVGSSPK